MQHLLCPPTEVSWMVLGGTGKSLVLRPCIYVLMQEMKIIGFVNWPLLVLAAVL